jgi:hypothetical protein
LASRFDSVCCGGTMLSHVNDVGFWMVNQYFGMTVPQTPGSWSDEIVTSICGMGCQWYCRRSCNVDWYIWALAEHHIAGTLFFGYTLAGSCYLFDIRL